ncbi:hypothetical protein GGH95_006016, partial [Coemansia sp. RSA 1836]
MPARGDLMQRHLQTCKYVEESVRQRFRRPPRSGSVSSSAGESKARKARIASVISEPVPPLSSAAHHHHHHQNNAVAGGSGSGYQQGQQRPGTAPVTLPSIATAVSMSPVGGGPCSLAMPPPLALGRPPYSLGSSHSPSNPENQLPRIRSPQLRSAAAMELPSISRRPHPYLGRPELFSSGGGGSANGHHRRSPGLRVLQHSPQRLGLRVSPDSSSRTPSSAHTSPSLPSAMA